MSRRDWVNEYADANELELLVMDEFDEAIVGICHRFNDSFVLYDRAKIIEILCREMSEEDAEDHFAFNIIGGWVGETTPGFIEYPEEDS